MNMHTPLQNILLNTDLKIHRYGHGVQLLNSKTNSFGKSMSVNDLLAMPLNVYFMNCDSAVEATNEAVLKTFNIDSIKDAIGITVRDLAKKETAKFSLQHDHQVMTTSRMVMEDESYERLDDISFSMLTIKFPWLHKNHIIGILGISLMIGKEEGASLADSLTLLTQTGLLQPAPTRQKCLPGLALGKIYFTRREKEIMFHLIRGKSANEIALIFNRSKRTIEHHIDNMKIKTNSTSKSELIERIIENIIP